jgi:PAS domain S-box-containing protein
VVHPPAIVTDRGVQVVRQPGGDVTERADPTDRQRQRIAEAHLAAIVDSTTDAIAATNLAGVITSWNRGAERLLGYPADEIIGRPIYTVVVDELRERLARLREQVLDGGTVEPFESRRRRKDGTEVDVEVTLSAIHDRNGTLLGVSAIFRDITERRRAEADRARAQHEHEALAMLADRERIARDLHDLVIQRVFAAGLSLHAATALANARLAPRLRQVCDELDDVITEIRTTIFGLEHRHTGDGFRGAVLDLATGAAPTLGHEPVVRFDGAVDDVPRHIAEHAVAVLREAFANVARHAHATATTVEVSAGDHLAVTVADNGVGLATTTRISGLRNLRSRATALGGHLDLRTRPHGGTRLTWTVPLASTPGRVDRVHASPDAEVGAPTATARPSPALHPT